jgi:hypothetical protein
MDTALAIAVASASLAVVGAVVSAWYARRAASTDARRTVDELAATVEHWARQQRRDTMRRVRAAAGGGEASGGAPEAPPGAPQAVAHPVSLSDHKAALRRRMRGAA